MTDIMILKANLSFVSSIPQQYVSEFSNLYFGICDDGTVTVPLMTWLEKHGFEEELENLLHFSRQIKNKVKGDFIVCVKDETNMQQGRYKISRSKYLYEPCEININIRKSKPSASKPLTEEEKLNLFREFWNLKHEVPKSSEVYKGFRIGSYFASMMKNQNAISIMNDIMKNEMDDAGEKG